MAPRTSCLTLHGTSSPEVSEVVEVILQEANVSGQIPALHLRHPVSE